MHHSCWGWSISNSDGEFIEDRGGEFEHFDDKNVNNNVQIYYNVM